MAYCIYDDCSYFLSSLSLCPPLLSSSHHVFSLLLPVEFFTVTHNATAQTRGLFGETGFPHFHGSLYSRAVHEETDLIYNNILYNIIIIIIIVVMAKEILLGLSEGW